MRRADIVLLNDGEVRQYADTHNLFAAAPRDPGPGPARRRHQEGRARRPADSRDDGVFVAPPFRRKRSTTRPARATRSPAGSWAIWPVGMTRRPRQFMRAMVHGTAVASFTVEDFSVRRLDAPTSDEVLDRYARFRHLTQFTEENDGSGAQACHAVHLHALKGGAIGTRDR